MNTEENVMSPFGLENKVAIVTGSSRGIGRSIADTFDDSTHRASNLTKRFLGTIKVVCGRTGAESYDDEADMEYERALFDSSDEGHNQPFYWSAGLQQSFREELEK